MVSLRKSTSTPKFQFSEGETVLTYEPDSNKTKLLYDSKILKIITRDGANRSSKKIEYSVHFFGWSSSWNRKVSEEYLLKDTPSNRQLQRELAQKAAGQLKGKKLKLNKIPHIIREVITNNVINSLNEQEDQNAKDGYEQANIDDISGEESSNSNFNTHTTNSNSTINELEQTNQNNSPNNFQTAVSALKNHTVIKSVNEANLFTVINNQITNCINQPVNGSQNLELCQQIITNLDEEIKNLLEKDQYKICNEKQLYNLPVSSDYTVHKILESYQEFSLRMLNSSINQLTNLKPKKSNQSDKKDNQSNNQSNNNANSIQSNSTNASNNNRLNSNSQLTNRQSNGQTLNNFNSTNSTSSSSSQAYTLNNCTDKQSSKDFAFLSFSLSNQTILEFTNSMEIYFNTLTERFYIFYNDKEIEQFKQLKEDKNYIKPINTFGFVHLLRLIILLPDFLSPCSIQYRQLKQVIFLLDHFCKYLVDNQTKFIAT